jgi:hypothetical protein
VSIPSACNVLTARGFSCPLGKLPELTALKPLGARWLNNPSERTLRQLFAVHINSTFMGFS